jgi:sugar/nucleoside kinase (ribokinase family)
MIVAIGNPVYDLIQTPQVKHTDRVLSGCSTNGCLAASKLGEKTALIGRVGHDMLDQFQADMAKYGIESHIDPCAETGGFSLIYDEKGDRTLDVLGVADPIQTFPAQYANADFIMVGPILGETPQALVEQIVAVSDAPLILDPQGFMRRIKNGRIDRYLSPELVEVLPLFDIVKANEYETQIITGYDPLANPTEAVTTMYEMMHAKPRRANHPAIAIATLAHNGSLIYMGDEVIRIPAYLTNTIDPTGSGDTYAGGFMVQYLRTPDDLARCGCHASATASIMGETVGPDFGVTPEEVERRTEVLLGQM